MARSRLSEAAHINFQALDGVNDFLNKWNNKILEHIKIRSSSVHACVVKQRKGDRYKVKYDKNGKTQLRWFPVSQVTSKTKNIENKKQPVKKSQDTSDPSEQRKFHRKKNNFRTLSQIPSDRGLRLVEVEGDGNCFFRVIAPQIYGDSKLYKSVRVKTVEQVMNKPTLFNQFIEEGQFDEFVATLSTNREWADNLAIQAVADAYGILFEIINSNQVQYGTRIINPRGVENPHRHLVIAHIASYVDEVGFSLSKTAAWVEQLTRNL
ncbi:OTU domain-containing protein 5-A-like [Hydractinia symbiolongicarpus]|uniref:OTU domain-containing protein 5-A-like n=1 Tax=Hydractinia symbiolongicarpus TaxID=13093 RepID=UPI00254C85B0|nr:OTU domain-containing protein 5-A-like [Hydractinia symbiolongicarpus]